ncbi:Dicarboxylic amino acid permease [Lasiodiplodia theobromae]|uniref:Dicarboxylic amino acid permease n=1 Tax=Lasiodiplodia theobromae TaxID=45133 RepID=A0A5N5D127_9PEZI|nr:Dicarboxylic amino acid permease [Lasiodiplodia theobromae]
MTDIQKGPDGTSRESIRHGEVQHASTGSNHELQRRLKSRHVTMIALGGSLGTGLLVGTGAGLVKAGPGGLFIDYTVIGCVVFLVMSALGEMASFVALPHGFGGYASRFTDPALGFATGYVYLFKYLLATPNQLAAASLIMKYWTGDRVNPAVYITVILVVIALINYGSVAKFGEFEFWLSSVKVVVICGVILLLLIIALGGGPTHDRTGFRYWNDPGAFVEYKTSGDLGKFVGVWSGMVSALYAFSGTELVGITVGEAQNPRVVMPKAIKMTFYRILFFYIFSILVLGMVVPYNSEDLVFATKSSTSAAASPFVVAIKIAKIQGLDHVINACLMIFAFSAANSDLYTAVRTLYGISRDGKAPRVFSITNKSGVPIVALATALAFCLLAYMSVGSGAKTVLGYLTNVVTVFSALTWIGILVSHISFRRAVVAQRIGPEHLAYIAPFRHYGSYVGICFLVLLILTKGLEAFIGGFDYKTFIVQYIGIPVYLVCIFGYKLWYRTETIPASQVDLVTGVATETVAEEKARLAVERKEAEVGQGPARKMLGKVYRVGFQWLF